MKILHTADWHIGKVLHKHPLQDELKMFMSWLLDTIDQEDINLLLISGDIFDLANPSANDREMYYQFLSQLSHKNLQVIITGGNHDSPGLLNAPKDVLKTLNITVIGGATENIQDEIIPIKDNNEEIHLLVVAVPFLRDADLRNKETDEKYKTRTEAIREGIINHYDSLADYCEESFNGIPTVAMGHLYAIGADPSDSERDIHVGNAAAIDAHVFSKYEYMALGHIHRPQIISKNEMIRYSGSPIALSFSEKTDEKSILVLELTDGKLSAPKVIPVPKFRELKKISGNLLKVKGELEKYSPDFPLTSFVELEVNEKDFSTVILSEVEELKSHFSDNPKFKILKGRTNFEQGTKDTSDLFKQGQLIADLKPMEVFSKRLELEPLESEDSEALKETFLELLELVTQSEEV